jgi:hypothetical protein
VIKRERHKPMSSQRGGVNASDLLLHAGHGPRHNHGRVRGLSDGHVKIADDAIAGDFECYAL